MTAPNLEQIVRKHLPMSGVPNTETICSCGLRVDPGAHAAHVVAAIRDSGYTVIALPEAEAEYPETLAVAKLIYENLPSEDPGGSVEPWDELTAERRAPFLMNARNLGHVFPEEYPKLAAELARYRAAQHAGDTQ